MQAKQTVYGGAALAYLGDAVIELYVRRLLVETGISSTGVLNKISRDFVRATAQSASVGKILDLLTEAELTLYKRGRNTNGISPPKSASAGEYRRATGLEALMGQLYLDGDDHRIKELLDAAYAEQIAALKEKNV